MLKHVRHRIVATAGDLALALGETHSQSAQQTPLILFRPGMLMALLAVTPASHAATLVLHQEAEAMTRSGCTGASNGTVTFYCNNDVAFNSASFSTTGRYEIIVRGASTNSSAAGLSVYVAGSKIGATSFSSTAFSNKGLVFDLASSGAKEVRLRLETDTGANDTLVDWYELTYHGPTPPPPPAPVPPSTGAFSSGRYRNLFQEMDASITEAAVQTKLNQFWQSLFASTDESLRVYYPFGSNANGSLAYIKDTGNNDVRSEGVSYGMMIAVQMNKQAEFNALWNFAKSFMQHQTGARKGYFAWQVSTSGSVMDANPASDGEAYFATALFFASGRWGNGSGIYNYTAEANAILDAMLHKEDMNGGVVESVTNMFNKTQKMVVFVPFASAANFTDPSYHLPAFYELWGRWAAGYNGQQAADRQFWLDAAATSRQFFVRTTNPSTGLAPDYAEFSGAPNNTGNHGDFRFDAWRTALNWSVDYAWFAKDSGEKTLSDRIQTFFKAQGISSYANQFSLSGNPLSSDHSPGLVACNGAASLASTNSRAWEFVRELWNLNPPTGQFRYYDGMLSYMSLLHAAGNFRIYAPSVPSGGSSSVTVLKSGAGAGTVTSSPSGINCGATCTASYASGTSVTLTASASSGSTFSGWSGACSGTGTCIVNANGQLSVTATFTTSGSGGPSTNPYSTLEAESYSEQSGTITESADGGTAVNLTASSSYIAFNGLSFGTSGAGSVQFRVSNAISGANLQIRIGSRTAAPACTVFPDGNGVWAAKSNTCFPKPTGTQTIYITTTAPLRINWLRFFP